MSGCSLRLSLRNRFLLALLPLAEALFRLQDAFYRWLGVHPWQPPTIPPAVSIAVAAPYAPETGFLRDRHGYRLFYRLWPPRGSAQAVLIAFDGLGSHSRQFHPLGALGARGIAFVGLDPEGHGLSEGPRGDLTRYPDVVDGVADAITDVGQKFPDAPVYLLGESLGAPLAMELAVRPSRPATLAGLILSSPELNPTQLTAQGGWETVRVFIKHLPFLLFWSYRPSIDITGRERLVARGPEVYERSRRDPLRVNRVSVRTIVTAYALIGRAGTLARQIHLPVLVLQAECDRVDNPESAPEFFRCLATGDKELVYFPGAAHGLYYDPDTPQVVRVVGDWIARHCERWRAPVQQCEDAAG
ncbi:MAG TPA: alpha/beta fold hydrolase [Chloroflexota bacterium]|nr:alpha/beta fold hydrolase [Chloroflexota bacterium]